MPSSDGASWTDTVGSGGGSSDRVPKTKRVHKSTVAWAVAVVLVALFAVYAFGGVGATSSPSFSQTTSTTYNMEASSMILSAAMQHPAGYNATSSGLLKPTHSGEQSAAYATLRLDVLNEPQSSANMTALVFDTTNSSQAYYDSFVSHVRGLPGYTDISSVIAGYQRYGTCYAYGEDVDGIAVANGICTDGNVFLEVHLSSSQSLQQLEGDLSSLMGAMYQSV